MLCFKCISRGYCQNRYVAVVEDRELASADFLIDLKWFLVLYSFQADITPEHWLELLTGLYRDYSGWLRGRDGGEVFLDMSVFEIPHIREWFRDFIKPVPPGVRPRIRAEARERVRALATVMRAHFPEESVMWGVRATNDNDPLLSPHNRPRVR